MVCCYQQTLSNGESCKARKDVGKVSSLGKVIIPAKIGDHSINTVFDIVKDDIPLLPSKESMKKADTNTDFANHSVSMFGTQQKLVNSSSSHYTVPLAWLDKFQAGNVKVILVAMTTYISDKMKVTMNLYSVFSFSSSGVT